MFEQRRRAVALLTEPRLGADALGRDRDVRHEEFGQFGVALVERAGGERGRLKDAEVPDGDAQDRAVHPLDRLGLGVVAHVVGDVRVPRQVHLGRDAAVVERDALRAVGRRVRRDSRRNDVAVLDDAHVADVELEDVVGDFDGLFEQFVEARRRGQFGGSSVESLYLLAALSDGGFGLDATPRLGDVGHEEFGQRAVGLVVRADLVRDGLEHAVVARGDAHRRAIGGVVGVGYRVVAHVVHEKRAAGPVRLPEQAHVGRNRARFCHVVVVGDDVEALAVVAEKRGVVEFEDVFRETDGSLVQLLDRLGGDEVGRPLVEPFEPVPLGVGSGTRHRSALRPVVVPARETGRRQRPANLRFESGAVAAADVGVESGRPLDGLGRHLGVQNRRHVAGYLGVRVRDDDARRVARVVLVTR